MSESDFDAEAFVDAAAAAIGLPVPPVLRGGVIEHVRVTRRMSELVMALPLPDDAEAAPVFRP